jgi:anti-anti-sigma factor
MEMRSTEGSVQPIRVETDGEQQRLCLEGVVNAALARRLKEEALVALAGPGPVTLDLARAEYLDGAALQVLMALNTELVTRGRSFKVVAMAPSVEETLRVVGLAGALGAGPRTAVESEGGELA